VAFLRFTPVATYAAGLIALAAIAIISVARERSVSVGTSSFRIHHLLKSDTANPDRIF
jgi:hypothetical protein